MKSMTGFGRGEAKSQDGKLGFRVEISSVNRKQFELKINLPKEMLSLESMLRCLAASKISRGSLSMRVEVSMNGGNGGLRINQERFRSLASQLRELGAGETDPAALLNIPGIVEEDSVDYNLPENEELLKKACNDALENLIRMRASEGEHLRVDLDRKVNFLSDTLDKIEPLVKELPLQQQKKLQQRIQELKLEQQTDDDRLLRELVIFTDRYDVSEEITRLRSHFRHFHAFLNDQEESLGRNMDFLSQEIFRELNTLGNKAGSVDVSPLIVLLKTEVEKIREQVQNIE